MWQVDLQAAHAGLVLARVDAARVGGVDGYTTSGRRIRDGQVGVVGSGRVGTGREEREEKGREGKKREEKGRGGKKRGGKKREGEKKGKGKGKDGRTLGQKNG